MPNRPGDNAELFRAVADYTYDWESWHGPAGELLWVNRAVERVTGYKPAECDAMVDYPLPIVVAEDRDRVRQALHSARSQTSGENVEFRCRSKAGEIRWMSLAWQPICDSRGKSFGFRTSIRDITELQRLREQLQLYADHLEQLVQERTLKLRQLEQRQLQMEKLAALGQLAAGVAHEINNPLAGIRNAFELIKSNLSPSSEHYDLLELIDREFDRISGIIHQMYQLYRRGIQPAEEFALERTVGEVVALLGSVARKQQAELTYHPPPEPIAVQLAEGEVKQILYNVIRNAIQASPPGGAVRVGVSLGKDSVQVEVEDEGAGIPDDILPRIFEPFYSTKQGGEQSGMGLGLSVSRSLIDAMGGRIDVRSEPGSGSLFVLTFPLRPRSPGDDRHV